MDGLGEQRLADTSLSDDHERSGIGRESRNSRLESRDGRAVAYDLNRFQSSGPGVGDHVEVTGSNPFDKKVLSGEWSLDSKGLWTLG